MTVPCSGAARFLCRVCSLEHFRCLFYSQPEQLVHVFENLLCTKVAERHRPAAGYSTSAGQALSLGALSGHFAEALRALLHGLRA